MSMGHTYNALIKFFNLGGRVAQKQLHVQKTESIKLALNLLWWPSGLRRYLKFN